MFLSVSCAMFLSLSILYFGYDFNNNNNYYYYYYYVAKKKDYSRAH